MAEATGVSLCYDAPCSCDGRGPTRGIASFDLCLERGRSVAVLGPSGSGKSTLLSILGLLRTPHRGSLTFGGVSVPAGGRARAHLRAQQVAFVFQTFELLAHHSVRDNVALAYRYRPGTRAADHQRVDAVLDQVGLAGHADDLASTLSGGEKQRAAVARALVLPKPLLIADEPTGNLDRANAEGVVRLLLGAADEGRAVVIVTHDEAIAARADHVVRLAAGRRSGADAGPGGSS